MREQPTFLISVLVKFAAFLKYMTSLRYKVTIEGAEILKDSSPSLILPNHQALIDPIILMSHIYRDTNAIPVISSTFYDIPLLKSLFTSLGAVRVSNLEAGSRNLNVLSDISRSVLKGFRRGKCIVLYPSGQLAAQGYEKIYNKKSTQYIVSRIPDDVKVLGVRITGLWGSMWSKAKTGKTPNLFIQMLKAIFYVLANLVFFMPRRTVTIHIEDLTNIAAEKAKLGRKPFNLFLEDFYNQNGEENLKVLNYFFYTKY
jgi:1-acyl-sn-glycerol-3-phosphate acyltransferase